MHICAARGLNGGANYGEFIGILTLCVFSGNGTILPDFHLILHKFLPFVLQPSTEKEVSKTQQQLKEGNERTETK